MAIVFKLKVRKVYVTKKGDRVARRVYYYVIVPKAIENAVGRPIDSVMVRHGGMTFVLKVTGAHGKYYLAPMDSSIYETLGRPDYIMGEVLFRDN